MESEEKHILDKLAGVASLFESYADQFGSVEFMDDEPESEERDVLNKIKKLKMRDGVEVVFIDYLQLIVVFLLYMLGQLFQSYWTLTAEEWLDPKMV